MISPSVLLKIGNISEKILEKIKHAFYIQRPFSSKIPPLLRICGKI